MSESNRKKKYNALTPGKKSTQITQSPVHKNPKKSKEITIIKTMQSINFVVLTAPTPNRTSRRSKISMENYLVNQEIMTTTPIQNLKIKIKIRKPKQMHHLTISLKDS
eukprot:132183_1